jgi:hypothetical protein
MSRPHRARGTLLLTLLLAAGCQDYNFNPVGHCLIQPGTRRVELSSLSSADVLFVVDDSGSMGGEQIALADNFSAFIDNLDAANAARATAGLLPIDFHIAVTSTSVFWNYQTSNPATTCRSDCSGAAGQLVCCKTDGTPARQPMACTWPGTAGSCPAGTTCGANCPGLKGENYCCDQSGSGSYPAGSIVADVPCSRAGTLCGSFEQHYNFPSCSPGAVAGMDEWPYPRGEFISWSNGATPNPRVLHFDKELYTAGVNRQGFTSEQLIGFFSGGTNPGNVVVGTCGSGEEQALSAARLAIEKARDGLQKDTYPREKPASGPILPTWNLATRTAGSTADWFVAGADSKLVVVFVGDEDDCSSPPDPSGGVVMLAEATGNDACTRDASTPAPLGGKQFSVDSFVDFFTGLGRPVAAGFILPASEQRCTLETCTATSLCCPAGASCPSSTAGAQSRGVRLLETAKALAARGVEVVAGSICDPSFGTLLDEIAEIVKPPTGLELPSQPAATEVTLLRIEADGQTRKICGRPLAPRAGTNYTLAQAQETGADWWFTATSNPGEPAPTSRFVYINPAGSCVANPGETYSADYLGMVPAGGCLSDAQCGQVLGGNEGSWTCYAGVEGDVCVTPTAAKPGTCICGARPQNCPNG